MDVGLRNRQQIHHNKIGQRPKNEKFYFFIQKVEFSSMFSFRFFLELSFSSFYFPFLNRLISLLLYNFMLNIC